MLRARSLIFALLLLVSCNSDPESKIKDLQKADLLAKERALISKNADPSPSPTPESKAQNTASKTKKPTSNYELLTKIELSPTTTDTENGDKQETENGETADESTTPEASPSPSPVNLSQIIAEAADEDSNAPQFAAIGEAQGDPNIVINQPSTQNSNLIGGVVTRRPTPTSRVTTDEGSDESADASPSPSPKELLVGPPRGYAILTLMQPNARRSVERQLQTLIDANIKNVFLGVLTDGTFAKDFEYLALVIRRVVGAGRNLTLALYLTNGASMRDFENTPVQAPFTQIDPIEFRELIQHDKKTRAKFIDLVREVRPIFELNQRLSQNNRNIAIVMLEDNLDGDAYLAMRELARAELGNLVEYVRNPCPGCYKGNDAEVFGDKIEIHDVGTISSLRPGDGFTLDGVGFSASPVGKELSLSQVEQLLNIAAQRQLGYFGLWKAERQGVIVGSVLDPNKRVYQEPTDQEMGIETQLLRLGLN